MASTAPHKIGIVGIGKITTDQHIPAIRANPAFELAAVASTSRTLVEGVSANFPTLTEMLARVPDLTAIAINTPPQVRHALAVEAISAGKGVLLEKPPAATVSELADMEARAAAAGTVLFATWHAQHNKAVDAAKAALAGQTVKRLSVSWKEDVRHWHPGQAWIWQPGAFGVFDPGMNALSILTKILPDAPLLRSADLSFPKGRDTPIAARLAFTLGSREGDYTAEFDWRQTGPQTWNIEITTQSGQTLLLSEGGGKLAIDGRETVATGNDEYPDIYRRFDELLTASRSDVDAAPFRLVGDAMMLGRRIEVEAFED